MMRTPAGQRAMREAGLEAEFLKIALPESQAFRILDNHGQVLLDGTAKPGQMPRPEVDRTALRDVLLDSVRPEIVRWNHRLAHVTPLAGGRYRLHFTNGQTAGRAQPATRREQAQPPSQNQKIIVATDSQGDHSSHRISSLEAMTPTERAHYYRTKASRTQIRFWSCLTVGDSPTAERANHAHKLRRSFPAFAPTLHSNLWRLFVPSETSYAVGLLLDIVNLDYGNTSRVILASDDRGVIAR
jgi:hypothetical protein